MNYPIPKLIAKMDETILFLGEKEPGDPECVELIGEIQAFALAILALNSCPPRQL